MNKPLNAALIGAIVGLLSWGISGMANAQRNVNESPTGLEDKLPDIPVGITSFGGAVADGHLYIYGGHDGEAHQYYQSGQNATLYRLNLDEPKKWEAVNKSKGLQGLAMVAHGGNVYRLGGFEARNAQGEDQDLHSVADFAMFDAAGNAWIELPPMPMARSSFDAAVVDDILYVVGGWTIAGDQPTVWCDDALMFDLRDHDSVWQKLPTPPFKRRALSVSFQGDKLYVIGGMQQQGGPTRKAGVLDLKALTWSEGPELPGDNPMEGFGNSSFNVGGHLIVSTYGGSVYRLNEAGDTWKKIHQLKTGRFFHRLLPFDDQHFVLVGGASMESGKVFELEVLPISKN